MFAELESLVRLFKETSDVTAFQAAMSRFDELDGHREVVPPDALDSLQRVFALAATTEPAWALISGLALWRSKLRGPVMFTNIWNCALFAGFQSRHSLVAEESHASLWQKRKATRPSRAMIICLGNNLRRQHCYSAAEDAYLEGIHRYPDDPFLKLRLADLYLATCRYEQARQLLMQLRPDYPYAREMMFLTSASEAAVPAIQIPDPCVAEGRDLVCLVAADPVYVERYALAYAQSLRSVLGDRAMVHFHVVCDESANPQPRLKDDLAFAQCDAVITTRQYATHGSNPNWKRALYASERFLILPDILETYRKPVLMTDIDIEFLRDPTALLADLVGADFGYTNFRNTMEAWERYAATALLIQPTVASVSFFRRVASMIMATLGSHAQPWFVDQVALFRAMEENRVDGRAVYMPGVLTDSNPPSASGYFRILHGSWQ